MKNKQIAAYIIIGTMLISSLAFAAENNQQEKSVDFMQNINFEKTNIDNGAIFTVTSDDAETIEKIQNFDPSKMPKPDKHENAKDPEISFEKVNLDNGIELTITSENEEKVADIQERTQNHPKPKDENVKENVELLDNGVKITITSDDPETVEKIQNHQPGEKPENGENQKEPKEDLES